MDGQGGNLIKEKLMINIIKEKIKKQIDVIKIEIIDESMNHANHSGNSGGGHYRALIISNDFNDKSSGIFFQEDYNLIKLCNHQSQLSKRVTRPQYLL